MTLRIRPARPADLGEITALYNHYVEAGPATFDVETFRAEDRRAWLAQFDGARHPLLVADEDAAVVGYAGATRLRPKAAYDSTVETTVYVAPGEGGRGIGSALYAALFEALAGQDLHRAYAGITLPNDASLRLHRRFGFEEMGVWREVGRKHGRYWDVSWWARPL